MELNSYGKWIVCAMEIYLGIQKHYTCFTYEWHATRWPYLYVFLVISFFSSGVSIRNRFGPI